jgi:hypothetical protein
MGAFHATGARAFSGEQFAKSTTTFAASIGAVLWTKVSLKIVLEIHKKIILLLSQTNEIPVVVVASKNAWQMGCDPKLFNWNAIE